MCCQSKYDLLSSYCYSTFTPPKTRFSFFSHTLLKGVWIVSSWECCELNCGDHLCNGWNFFISLVSECVSLLVNCQVFSTVSISFVFPTAASEGPVSSHAANILCRHYFNFSYFNRDIVIACLNFIFSFIYSFFFLTQGLIMLS